MGERGGAGASGARQNAKVRVACRVNIGKNGLRGRGRGGSNQRFTLCAACKRGAEAGIAQLVEQRIRNARVVGSSPIPGSIFLAGEQKRVGRRSAVQQSRPT